jgi:signal peptidase I
MREWIVNCLVLLFGFAMVAQPYIIPTGSMENNLLVGDHVIVDKLAYAPPGTLGSRILPYQPVCRGDVVVFRFPPDIRQTYVKRVIGLPGDRIRIVGKQVYVNGQPFREPYKLHKSADRTLPRRFPRRPLWSRDAVRHRHVAPPRSRR